MDTPDDKIFADVKEVIVKIFPDSKIIIKPETSFIENLQADSLDTMELVMALEEKFHITIADDTIKDLKTVQDVVNYIQKIDKK